MDDTSADAERSRKQLGASSVSPGDANPHSGSPDVAQRPPRLVFAGCEPCAACLHCALCSTCTECYKCFTTPVAVDPTAADTQQRAMSIQSVTSWPHGGRMAGSSVSRCALRSPWHRGADAVAPCSSAPPRRRRARPVHSLTAVGWCAQRAPETQSGAGGMVAAFRRGGGLLARLSRAPPHIR
jgi:hypothetical protein